MVKRLTRENEKDARKRLEWIKVYELTGNVTNTCRFFTIPRSKFYFWYKRYKELGIEGLQEKPPIPNTIINRTPQHLEDLVIKIRREKNYGSLKISWYLQRQHNIYISSVTIDKILKRNKIPRISNKNTPRVSAPEISSKDNPGDRLQVDVKFLNKLSKEKKRFYQFTAIDDCTRYRILKIYDYNTEKSAMNFIECLKEKLPFIIKEIQTDNGNEFGHNFTYLLNDMGITHRKIYPGCPKQNGKVERSHRTDEEEFYRRNQFENREDLQKRVEEWEKEYNFDRPHTSLDGLTPAEKLHTILSTNKEKNAV